MGCWSSPTRLRVCCASSCAQRNRPIDTSGGDDDVGGDDDDDDDATPANALPRAARMAAEAERELASNNSRETPVLLVRYTFRGESSRLLLRPCRPVAAVGSCWRSSSVVVVLLESDQLFGC